MACVLSPEIVALLDGGPPAIDWDAIRADLKRDYLANLVVKTGTLVPDDEDLYGVEDDVRRGELVENVVGWKKPSLCDVTISGDGGGKKVYCTRGCCLHHRDIFHDLRVIKPTVVVSGGSLKDMASVEAQWVTFSKESAKDLLVAGIDEPVVLSFVECRFNPDPARPVIVYRGDQDDCGLVECKIRAVARYHRGDVSYVTSWSRDESTAATWFSHLYTNGGKVCGYNARGHACGLCADSGLVRGVPGIGYSLAGGNLPYCLCIAGRVREDFDFEANERRLFGTPLTQSSGSDGGVREVDAAEDTANGVVASFTVDLRACVGGDRSAAQQHLTCPDPDVPGMCYLHLFRERNWGDALVELGLWPTVEQLLLAPARYVHTQNLRGCAFVIRDAEEPDDGRTLHLIKTPHCTYERIVLAWPALRDVCHVTQLQYRGRRERTLAHLLYVDEDPFAVLPSIELADVVGGTSAPSGGVSLDGFRPDVKVITMDDGSGKGLCRVCGFLVRLEGHEARCGMSVSSNKTARKFDGQAWIGDALLTLDVRRYIAPLLLSPEERHKKHLGLLRGANLAKYYRELNDPPEDVLPDMNDHTVATLFERNYRGVFRENFLHKTMKVSAGQLDEQSRLYASRPGVDDVTAPGKRVYALVMPPAHGKSTHHGLGRLVESDALCDPKSTQELIDLKSAARMGVRPWCDYVFLWAYYIREGTKAGDVVMVPDVDVAWAAGFKVIAAILLQEDAWKDNLVGRTHLQIERAAECYASVEASDVLKFKCKSNDEVTRVLTVFASGLLQ